MEKLTHGLLIMNLEAQMATGATTTMQSLSNFAAGTTPKLA
jgi:hypothetical protein